MNISTSRSKRSENSRHLVQLAPHRLLSLFRQPAGQCRAVPAGGVRAQLSRGQPAFERDRGRHHPGGLAGRPGRGAARAAAHAVARHRRPRLRQHAALPRAGAVGQHLGLLPDGRARRAAAGDRAGRARRPAWRTPRRGLCGAGDRRLCVRAGGAAARRLRDLGGARLARGGARRRRGRDRDRARLPAHAVAGGGAATC